LEGGFFNETSSSRDVSEKEEGSFINAKFAKCEFGWKVVLSTKRPLRETFLKRRKVVFNAKFAKSEFGWKVVFSTKRPLRETFLKRRKGVLSTQSSLSVNLVGRWFFQRNVLFERRF
jgi:hypothetical protein